MTKKQKKSLIFILIGIALFLAGLFCEGYVRFAFMLAAWAVTGWSVVRKALRNIARGSVFDEHFLMTVATVGAFALGEYPEGAAVMIFFQIGELFESLAVERSRRSISSLMDLRPDSAWLWRDGEAEEIDPDDIQPGDILLVRPGERIPVDGVIVEGDASLDTAQITGESLPVQAGPGEQVLSGCIDLSGVLKIRAESAYEHSTVARILDLVENAAENKSRSERFITRFARVYTPIVVALAVLVAVVPPLLTGGDWVSWIYRGLLFLVVSCPCALVISVPLTFFGGLGGASRKGILIKGSALMDRLAGVKTVVFDKTGTLTEGVFEVTAVHPEATDREELLHLSAHVERHSTHPIAMALRNAYPQEQDDCTVEDVREIAGQGVCALVNGRHIAVGNHLLMEAEGAAWRPCHHNGTLVHVAIDGVYAGHIVISDRIKADSAQAVSLLKQAGVLKTVMLTGDRQEVAENVAKALSVDEFHAQLLPAGKVAQVERLLPEGTLAFVGDGINDAPVLTRADIGIAMGALGSDAAIEAADVVLMDDKPSKIASAIDIARRTLRIARENIWFAIGVKVLVLVLAALGLATMWMAVFADVGVTVLAVLNAMRALRS